MTVGMKSKTGRSLEKKEDVGRAFRVKKDGGVGEHGCGE